MVLAKADPEVAAFYDARLVDKELQPLGKSLRDKYQQIVKAVLELTNHQHLVELFYTLTWQIPYY